MREFTPPIAFNIECAYDLNKNQLMCRLGDIIHIVGNDDGDVVDTPDTNNKSGFDDKQTDEYLDDREGNDDAEATDETGDDDDEDPYHILRKLREDTTCSLEKGTLSCPPKTLKR